MTTSRDVPSMLDSPFAVTNLSEVFKHNTISLLLLFDNLWRVKLKYMCRKRDITYSYISPSENV